MIFIGAIVFPAGNASAARATSANAASPETADYLLFCNSPERLASSGTYATTELKVGKTYRIFFHYRNVGNATRPLVLALHGANGTPFSVRVHKGIAEPGNDPPLAGRQAMARYLNSPAQQIIASKGYARFPLQLKRWDVASGVVDVRPDKNVRLSIYFGHNRYTVPGARVVTVDAPHRDITVALSAAQKSQYVRIGQPLAGVSPLMDGMYGLFYTFRVQAPAGHKVRIVFSPRGGKSGLVGTLAGLLHESAIVDAAQWAVFGEANVGVGDLVLNTAPFGGVFYPVEVAFHLL